jgi:anaerobic magnesium-protoporphyrin IX monomethyl ester cyclase
MDIPIVLGGPHVSVVSEELDFESLRQPQVDMVVRGEGEGPWIEISNIVDDFLRDQPEFTAQGLMDPALDLFRETLGVSYKTSDGQLHRNADAPVIADLDSLPWPAYHLFKMDRYTNLQPATDAVDGARSFSIMTSRGCPYRCTFCSQSIMPIKWRARSPENVIGRVAPFGRGPGRAGDRRAGRQRQHPPQPAARAGDA